ncbi:MAG: hypothetical protein JSS69_03140 [Acidobacteria bacterium]|nr:hypothetical protein [Acidobacteriota bacterium]MBS1864888.1 hypothetical protein [Acidobacteriota bacterium]
MGEGNGVLGILWGGLIAGTMDITAAILTYKIRNNVSPVRLLQSVASGLLGKDAFTGGNATAVLGLFLHFVIAFGATTAFYLASRKMPWLIQNAVIAGILYGMFVQQFMQQVVLPLSAFHKAPFSWSALIIGLITHIVCVGLPIALSVRLFSK